MLKKLSSPSFVEVSAQDYTPPFLPADQRRSLDRVASGLYFVDHTVKRKLEL